MKIGLRMPELNRIYETTICVTTRWFFTIISAIIGRSVLGVVSLERTCQDASESCAQCIFWVASLQPLPCLPEMTDSFPCTWRAIMWLNSRLSCSTNWMGITHNGNLEFSQDCVLCLRVFLNCFDFKPCTDSLENHKAWVVLVPTWSHEPFDGPSDRSWSRFYRHILNMGKSHPLCHCEQSCGDAQFHFAEKRHSLQLIAIIPCSKMSLYALSSRGL